MNPTQDDANPLLTLDALPDFERIRPEHVRPALDTVLARNRAELEAVLAENPRDWESLMPVLDRLEDRIDRVWAPVRHLNSVRSEPGIREAYNAGLPKLSAYYSELGQKEALFQAYRNLREGPAWNELDPTQRKIVADGLRDFRLNGVDLPESSKQRLRIIHQRTSDLQARFEQNLQDATDAWTHHIPQDEAHRLEGVPSSLCEAAAQTARDRGLTGWLLTLQMPTYIGIMTFAADRGLRRALYEAFVTRASEVGPHAGQWDNGPLMAEILDLRQEEADLLGYANYAELSLVTKMAEDPDRAGDFLDRLTEQAKPKADEEFARLGAFAEERDGLEGLAPWDVAFYSERLRETRYAINEEELKAYFPAEQVVAGLFQVVGRLFGLRIEARTGVPVWDPEVRFYDIWDEHDGYRGGFYLDLYARENKRGGAWMDDFLGRRRLDSGIQHPIAFVTCNATAPVAGQAAQLTHDDVVTLFHEFGHALHHLLTQVEYGAVAGIAGGEWDAVELPSQLLENWCWEPEALDTIAQHVTDGSPLPRAMIERLRAARNFQAAMQMVRQLEFSRFDLRLHQVYRRGDGTAVIQRILDEVRDRVAVLPAPSFNRFQNGFAHIFAGGYAAGYYSYKWAEVLSADAFARFEADGILSETVGRDFRANILERGGSQPAMELFKRFRDREPDIEALLRQSGLTT